MAGRREGKQGAGRITGIGGVFFKAKDRTALASWYRDVLGLPVSDATNAKLGQTVWAAFDRDTAYFGPTPQDLMINYRVDDLDVALGNLRAAGAFVSTQIEEDAYGRFGWAVDPEGNRFELWEPVEGA